MAATAYGFSVVWTAAEISSRPNDSLLSIGNWCMMHIASAKRVCSKPSSANRSSHAILLIYTASAQQGCGTASHSTVLPPCFQSSTFCVHANPHPHLTLVAVDSQAATADAEPAPHRRRIGLLPRERPCRGCTLGHPVWGVKLFNNRFCCVTSPSQSSSKAEGLVDKEMVNSCEFLAELSEQFVHKARTEDMHEG